MAMSLRGSWYSRKSMLVVAILILVTIAILVWKEYDYRRPSRKLQPIKQSKISDVFLSGFIKERLVSNNNIDTTIMTSKRFIATTIAELVIQTQSTTISHVEIQSSTTSETEDKQTQSSTASNSEAQTTTNIGVKSSTLSDTPSTPSAQTQEQTTVIVNKHKQQKATASTRLFHVYRFDEENESMRTSVASQRCVTLRSPYAQAPICIYPIEKDIYISKMISQTGTWESENMNTVGKILHSNRNMTLFDVGCNIGVFTIMAAGMGHRVVAVDANRENLGLLTRSLEKGNLQERVTLIWNALADVRGDVTLHGFDGNIGGTYVKPMEASEKANTSQQKTASAILMNDLVELFRKTGEETVFMKIDIETYEWNAFKGGEYFLQTIDVRYILIEWMSYTKNQETGNKIIQFLTKLHYTPYDSSFTNRKLDVRESSSWNKEVLWVKEHVAG